MKLAYYCHTMMKQGSCLEKQIMQGTMPGARRRGRPRTAWMDNIKTWTGLSVEESVRMTTEDRDKWRKYVHGVANRRIEDGCRTEQNSCGGLDLSSAGWFSVRVMRVVGCGPPETCSVVVSLSPRTDISSTAPRHPQDGRTVTSPAVT